MRSAISLIVGALVLPTPLVSSAGGSGPVSSEATPQTLVSLPRRLTAFAQDGNRLAWDAAKGVVVYDLRRRHRTTIRGVADSGVLALGGDRVLFMQFDYGSNCGTYVWMMTATVRRPRPRKVARSNMDFEHCDANEDPRILVAGDRGMLVYRHYFDYFGDIDELRRVARGRATLIPGSDSPTALAVAGSRVAFAQTTRHWYAGHGGPTWSPDGTSVAFPGSLYNSDQGEPLERGAYVSSAGGGATQLFGIEAEQLDWSPDGHRFVFVLWTGPPDSEGEQTQEIYTSAPDGSGLEKLGAGSSPAWSPDGQRIAFVQGPAVFVAELSGGTVTRITKGHEATWSPDGKELAVLRDGHIYIANATDGHERFLPGVDSADWGLDWSPRGTTIAYVRQGEYACGDSVRLARIDGTGSKALLPAETCRSENDDEPAWSPDGSKIAFTRSGTATHSGIYIANADGSSLHRLASIPLPEDTSAVTISGGAGLSSPNRLSLTGNVQALALSPSILAALVRTSAGLRIELRKQLEREPFATVTVPGSAAPELSAAARWIVYRLGRTIRVIDGATGRAWTVATAAATPIDLSIEGRRIAWGENVGGRGRIRAVTLQNGADQ